MVEAIKTMRMEGSRPPVAPVPTTLGWMVRHQTTDR